jgi:hypothetical protein
MATDTSWKEILAFTFAGVALWFVAKPKGDKATAQQEHQLTLLTQTKKTQSAFSEQFYSLMLTQEGYKKIEDYLKKINMTVSEINDIADSIYDSKSYFDDDEDKLYSAFRIMKNITVCSIVSKVFKIRYEKNMYSYIANFLNTSEMSVVLNIINDKYFL